MSGGPAVFRPGGVTYLRIPAPDPARLAGFYRCAFGWDIRGDPGEPSFTDGGGHLIGHFQPDLPVGGDAGVRPYIYTDRIDDSLALVTAQGGTVTVPPFAEGDLWVALFRDPAGNIVGVWQHGTRT